MSGIIIMIAENLFYQKMIISPLHHINDNFSVLTYAKSYAGVSQELLQ